MKHSDEKHRLMLLVNRAQAYKWDGLSDTALQIIAAEDWSATAPMFQLAEAILRDETDRAIQLMKSIGANGDPRKSDYRTWPLFREIRKTKEFREAFETIFGEPIEAEAPVQKALPPDKASPDGNGTDDPPPTVQ